MFLDHLKSLHTTHEAYYNTLPPMHQLAVRRLLAPAWDGHLIRMFLDLAIEYGPQLIALIMALHTQPPPVPQAIAENGTIPETQP